MKLIQLNLWYGRQLMNVVRFLEKSPPDILCLQEVMGNDHADEFNFNNLQVLTKKLGYAHAFFSPAIDFATGDSTTFFGNAVLSRHPIDPVKTVFTHGEYRSGFSFKQREKLPWNFQHAAINGTHIINHHGFWVDGPKLGTDETMRQMGMVADYIAGLSGPVIFCGDLNLWPGTESLKRFDDTMRNLVTEYGVKTTRNFTAFKDIEICDYIFVNDQVKVNDFKVHDDVVSDHSMLELDFA
jgi:endonuclease/exonuclease/phosphatase family metal-dependent hydrolase